MNPRSVFLTGATGFVGRAVVARLRDAGIPEVRILARGAGPSDEAWPTGWRRVAGDLTQSGSWERELEGIDTVVHLAARTGKATRRELWAANAIATERLVAAARRAGVSRFLFVSSIAAGYPDRRHYHYATAKLAAEAAVLGSGLDALVVRPTQVFGPGSVVQANLEKLATLAVPIMFGPGVAIQPIHVEDLATALVAALGLDRWGGAVVDLGGPEAITTPELLAAIRARRGLTVRRPLRIPLEPLRTVLAAVEPLLLPLLPFTAGQLAAFANPAVVTRGPETIGLPRPTRGLDAMLA